MAARKPLIYIHRIEWCPYELYMDPANEALLRSFADVRNNGGGRESLSPAQAAEQLRGVDGILSLNGAHAEELTAEALESAGTVKVAAISHWWGDLHARAVAQWHQAGVQVLDASDACNQAVAEWTLGAAIAGIRKFDVMDRRMKSGEKWPSWRGTVGLLNGSTFGLVGVGRVGRWVLRYLAPFDVRMQAYDPYLTEDQAAELGVEKVSLDTLLQTSDIISLHAPVVPETQAMLGAHELGLIRDGALLLNSARAWLLDNDAFRKEMQKGRFRAYLDVFEPEPPPEDDVLRKLDNVVLTPHIAGTTDAMFLRCGRFAIEALRDWFVRD
jgi:phosphoglycerate dehydrogenase-like enzyme